MNRTLKILLIIIALVCFGVALSYPIRYELAKRSNEQDMQQLSELRARAKSARTAEATPGPTESPEVTRTAEPDQTETTQPAAEGTDAPLAIAPENAPLDPSATDKADDTAAADKPGETAPTAAGNVQDNPSTGNDSAGQADDGLPEAGPTDAASPEKIGVERERSIDTSTRAGGTQAPDAFAGTETPGPTERTSSGEARTETPTGSEAGQAGAESPSGTLSVESQSEGAAQTGGEDGSTGEEAGQNHQFPGETDRPPKTPGGEEATSGQDSTEQRGDGNGSTNPPQPDDSGSTTPPQSGDGRSTTTPQPGDGGSTTPPQPGDGGSTTPPQAGDGGSKTLPQAGDDGSMTTPQPGDSGESTAPPQPGELTPEATPSPEPTPTPTPRPTPSPTPDRRVRSDPMPYLYKDKVEFDESRMLPEMRDIYALNPDVVGWIYIADSEVDYPVVQTENEDFYLTHDFYGNENNNGQIIMDHNCDPYTPSYNLIISGHHMNSGAMFGKLPDYKSKRYWENHKIIELDTLMEHKEYVIFAAFHSADYDIDEKGFRYNADIQYRLDAELWLEEVRKNQLYDTGIDVEWGDEFLTLTTCNRERRKDGRFVVVARRIREGEIIE